MKLLMTLLVRDEIDIIRSNLDYHLNKGIDFVIATDNGSADGTSEILKEYEKGGRLEYFYEPPSDFSQDIWVTRMARLACAKYQADWVIHADADEFFVSKHKTLKDPLDKVPLDVNVVRVERHDFVPFERPCLHPPPMEMIYRKRQSLNIKGKPLPPKVIHRAVPDISVSQGNHSAQSPSFQNSEMGVVQIEIFHYPFRTFPQFETKIENTGSSYARNKRLPQGFGYRARHWHELLVKGQLESVYKDEIFEHKRLENALATGEIVEDRTLQKELAVISGATG